MSADHRARLEAQREFVRPLVIEAGAGTGKTATLVARVLAWLIGPGWNRTARRLEAALPPQGLDDERIAVATLAGVVAITFTEAAAAEMADRTTAGLAEVAAGRRPVGLTALDAPPRIVDDESARIRARALLRFSDQLQVRTIHSFCRKILADHPFEAGLHPHFAVDADGTVLREVVEDEVGQILGTVYGDPGDEDYLALASRGYGPIELADAVYEMALAGWTSAALEADPLAPERRAALIERLWTTANRLLTVLETRLLDGTRVRATRARNAVALLKALNQLRRRLRRGAGRRGKGRRRQGKTVEIADLQAWVEECLPNNLAEHLRQWERGEAANLAERERLSSVLEQLMPLAADLRRLRAHVLRLDPPLLEASRRVLRPLLDRVQGEMRARGLLGFADLLRETAALFARDRTVVVRLRHRIDQLLVDEFQDTDPLQCGLVRQLALTGPAGERPGLFVVGDPKQSIYGWRSADLAAYEDFVEAAIAAGGTRLVLDENFRSRPEILAEVERVVRPVMRRRAGMQPEFRALTATRASSEPQSPAVEHWVSWAPHPQAPGMPAEGNARVTAELEARALAADLTQLHANGVAWNEIGLLLRSLTDLELYLAALREARIPFVVSRDRQYYRRREIIDATALVRAVLAPEDRLALLAFLRSVVVGVPDAALIPLWTGGLPGLLAELDRPDAEKLAAVRDLAGRVASALPADVPGIGRVRGFEHNLVHAAESLAELRWSFRHNAVDVFVERLRRRTLFEATEAARYLGVFRHANLDRFFAELLTALDEEEGHRHRVLRRLRRRIAGGFEAEEARPETGEEAVQVTTIHKAKGLEFRHVYLVQTHKEAGQRRGAGATLEIDAHDGVMEYRLFGAATLGFDVLSARRDEVARAELVRTLYVAMTRASERLVLAGRRPLNEAEVPLDRAATHWDLLVHRDGEAPSPADLFELWQSGEPRLEAGGVVWSLPGRAAAPIAAADLAPAVPLPAPDAVRAARGRLAAARQRAARHMKRPFWQLASTIQGSGAAMAAGSAVHRVLATFDWSAEPETELARQRELLPDYVRLFASAADTEEALERSTRLLERFVAGPLFGRFLELGTAVVTRELPVLLPPEGGDSDAVGYVVGRADLVYRDPSSGSLVVADFKTDRVASPEAIADLTRRGAAQGAAYTRALAEALGLEERPRFELWFLDGDRVEVVDEG